MRNLDDVQEAIGLGK